MLVHGGGRVNLVTSAACAAACGAPSTEGDEDSEQAQASSITAAQATAPSIAGYSAQRAGAVPHLRRCALESDACLCENADRIIAAAGVLGNLRKHFKWQSCLGCLCENI